MLVAPNNHVKVECIPLNSTMAVARSEWNEVCARAVSIRKTGAMRFNSPPNWPAPPPGWVPPPDWRPDPSWPPPPPGWQVWVDDAPPNNKKPLIIVGIAALLVVIIGVVVGIWWFSAGTSDVTVTKPVKTDEEQIKDVVKVYQDSWNDSNFDGFKPIACKEWKDDPTFNETDFLDAREGDEKLDLTVTTVDIKGDDATATAEDEIRGTNDIKLVREDGKWKWCDF
jgi:hypothetical protein